MSIAIKINDNKNLTDFRFLENNSNNNNHYNNNIIYPEWTNKIKDLVLKWRRHVIEMSELHEEAGYRIKAKHNLIGIPTVIIPLIMTILQGAIDNTYSEESMRQLNIVNSVMYGITTAFSGIYSWLDLGNQYSLHFQYSARYYELVIKIDQELTYQKTPIDVFLTELRVQIDNLNLTAPDMPVNFLYYF